MPLTDMAVRTAKPRLAPFKVTDSGGLHLLVNPSGSRLWRLAYRFDGKQKQLAFGAYPAVTLAEAREARDAARKLLAKGIDPADQKRQAKAAAKAAAADTFGVIADEFLARMAQEGRAEVTIAKAKWLLDDFARPLLGERPIAEIKPAEVLAVLRVPESRGLLESARRLRSVLSRVFRLAIITSRTETDPTSALRGALMAPKVTHRAAVTDSKQFGELLRAVYGYEGDPAVIAALKLMALLFPRPGELRGATWDEFDLDAEEPVWTIPAGRMKMRRPHVVPMPTQAVGILRELHAITARGKLVFPGQRVASRPISENTLNAALRRLGYTKDEATSHGFRATASTLLNESGLWSADAVERALAHQDADAVRRAYARGAHWAERVKMMTWWADQCDALRLGAQVLPIRWAG